jgi:hypothetical protein
MNKEIIVMLGALLLSSSAHSISPAQVEFDVNAISSRLPMKLDDDSTLRRLLFLDSLSYKGVIYSLRFDHLDQQSIKSMEVKLKVHLKSKMCTSKWSRSVLDSGFSIDYVYEDRNGKPAVGDRLVAKDCK